MGEMDESGEVTVFVLTIHNLKDDARIVAVYASQDYGRAAANRLANSAFGDGFDYESDGDVETWTDSKRENGYMLQPKDVVGFTDVIEQGLTPLRSQVFAALYAAGYHAV